MGPSPRCAQTGVKSSFLSANIYSAAFDVVDQIIGSPKQYQSEKPFPYIHGVLVTILYLHRSDPLGMENVSMTMCATIAES